MAVTDSDQEVAWQWLKRRRQRAPPGADIRHLWFHWSRERQVI